MASVHEQLSEQFYQWELRGRGWQVFAEPVYPEPPFLPFKGHYLPEPPALDDGRRPTILSSLFRKITQPPPPVIAEVDEDPEPQILIRDPLVELQTSLPANLDATRDAFEQLFRNISLCRSPVAFELLGVHQRVIAQFAADKADASLVRRQLTAHFPDVQFTEREGTLDKAWLTSNGSKAFAVEFGLESEFMLPLAAGRLDAFVSIVGALAELQPGELGLFQVLWQPVQNEWAESIVNSVTHSDGKPFFVNQPELASAAENKVAKPLYTAVVRLLIRATDADRLHEVAREIAGALRALEHPQGNALIPLHNQEYASPEEHIFDVLRRQSRRSGMILNSDELFGLVHLPTSAVRSPALVRETGKTKPAPVMLRNPEGVLIGDNEHNEESSPAYLSVDQRVRHTHIIGSSGTGKSSLLFNLIRQDIERGEGVAVLDPHGDLIEQILGIIPENRVDNVVLVDPSDVEFPIGFNILQAHSEAEKNLLASDLIAVFRRLSSSWGDQMDTVLQNAILAFLESRTGGTLADLRRFLLEPAFRTGFLQTVQDPEIIYYWQKVFPQLSGGRSIGPILTRLQDFFARKPLRNMVSQAKNKLDFADIMDSAKIFLAKLSEGLCGAENSYLLGTLLVSKFQQLAMARQSQAVAVRKNFWLYVDEFDRFITPSMAEILKGARKYRLGLTLSHQELHQLHSDSKVESAVLTQPCTRIVFRVGDDDAKKLGEGFESFDAKALKSLENFHAIVRVERNDCDFNLAVRKPELPAGEAGSRKEEVIAASRAKYAVPRATVEADLLAKILTPEPTPASPAGGTPPPPAVPVTPKTIFAEIRKSTAERAGVSPAPPASETKPAMPAPVAATVSEKAVPPTLVEPIEIPKTVTEPASPPAEAAPEEPPKDLGRGHKFHTNLQKRIQQEAHKLGFKAEIEKQLKKYSMQAADVVLEDLDMAVEVVVSGGARHEFDNLKKCLDAGFARAVSVSDDRKRLKAIAAVVQKVLGDAVQGRVSYFTPDELVAELKRLAQASPPNSTAGLSPGVEKIGGCLVEDVWPEGDAEELKQQDDITFGMVADILKRNKKKKKPGS